MKVLQEYYMQQETVSDDAVTIIKLHFSSKDPVRAGDIVIDVETSKAVLEIDADLDGIIDYRCEEGDEIRNGALLFVLVDRWEESMTGDGTEVENNSPDDSCRIIHPLFSRRALAAMREKGLSEDQFRDCDFVTHQDVRRLIDGRPVVQDTATSPSLPSPTWKQETEKVADDDQVIWAELSPAKKTEINYLTRVQSAGMNSALHIHVDIEGLFTVTNAHFTHLKNSLLPLVVYETARLLNEYKELNAFYTEGRIAYYRKVNIGVAVDIDDGLKVLTIPDTNRLMPRQIEGALNERIDLYLDRKLKPSHVSGSTFTVSDLSSQNLFLFHPLINKDQSAILGISGVDEKLGRTTLSLVFDHRVTEGMRVSQFLNDLKERVESYRPHGETGIVSTSAPANSGTTDETTKCCHRCLKTLEEDHALSGPGLIRTIQNNGREVALCRDCLLGF